MANDIEKRLEEIERTRADLKAHRIIVWNCGPSLDWLIQTVRELRESKRVIICVWCGQVMGRTGDIAKDAETARSHDEACSKNPLRERAEKAEAQLASTGNWCEKHAPNASMVYSGCWGCSRDEEVNRLSALCEEIANWWDDANDGQNVPEFVRIALRLRGDDIP